MTLELIILLKEHVPVKLAILIIFKLPLANVNL